MGCKFEIGDRVRVRDFEDMKGQYGCVADIIDPNPYTPIFVFAKEMSAYCGECGTIARIEQRYGFYEIYVDFDDSTLNDAWCFADYMFEYEDIELPDAMQLYGFL